MKPHEIHLEFMKAALSRYGASADWAVKEADIFLKAYIERWPELKEEEHVPSTCTCPAGSQARGEVKRAGKIEWFDSSNVPSVRGGSTTLGIDPYDAVEDRKMIERHLHL